jgi:hypothetical protein
MEHVSELCERGAEGCFVFVVDADPLPCGHSRRASATLWRRVFAEVRTFTDRWPLIDYSWRRRRQVDDRRSLRWSRCRRGAVAQEGLRVSHETVKV